MHSNGKGGGTKQRLVGIGLLISHITPFHIIGTVWKFLFLEYLGETKKNNRYLVFFCVCNEPALACFVCRRSGFTVVKFLEGLLTVAATRAIRE